MFTRRYMKRNFKDIDAVKRAAQHHGDPMWDRGAVEMEVDKLLEKAMTHGKDRAYFPKDAIHPVYTEMALKRRKLKRVTIKDCFTGREYWVAFGWAKIYGEISEMSVDPTCCYKYMDMTWEGLHR